MSLSTRRAPHTRLPARLVRTLTEAGTPLHYLMLATRVGHPNPQHVAVQCQKLVKAGVLQRYGKGVYGVPPVDSVES